LKTKGHHLTLEDVQKFIVREEDVHLYVHSLEFLTLLNIFCSCNTEVIALENTLHGLIFPQDEITRISEYARERGVRMHLDGARIWHVAIETGTPLHELCEPFDSIGVCFSKGLGQLRQSVRTPASRTDSELSPFQVLLSALA
jgi:threonine aldolase